MNATLKCFVVSKIEYYEDTTILKVFKTKFGAMNYISKELDKVKGKRPEPVKFTKYTTWSIGSGYSLVLTPTEFVE